MQIKKIDAESASLILSIGIHIIAGAVVLLLLSFSNKPENLIQVSFGEPGGGSGGYGPSEKNISAINLPHTPAFRSVDEKKKYENDEFNVPKLTHVKKEDSEEKISSKNSKEKNKNEENEVNIKSAGNNQEGHGIGNGIGSGYGFGNGNGSGIGNGLGNGLGIDWAGKVRKIYNYTIPKYPDGVTKEIDVKLRFTILPDGTVGKITVVTKADSRLEQTAIESLRMWRFEPLSIKEKQTDQIALITFPFRLK